MTHASMDPLRKAAVLLASLEPATARLLLQQMDPHHAQRVREVLYVLGPVDDEEREAVVREFFASGAAAALDAHSAAPGSAASGQRSQRPADPVLPGAARAAVAASDAATALQNARQATTAAPAKQLPRRETDAGAHSAPDVLRPPAWGQPAHPDDEVELVLDSDAAAAGRPAHHAADATNCRSADPLSDQHGDEGADASAARRRRAFAFLEAATASDLTPCLAGEHPQTIALVMAYLPPGRAAQLLSRLPDALQADVLRRLSRLNEPDPEVLSEVERELQSRLARQRGNPLAAESGIQRVARILDGMPLHVQRSLWQHLQRHDAWLARQWSPPEFTYEQFLELDEESVHSVLAALAPELAVLALADSPPEFVNRILQHMPPREARLLRYALDHLGPTRLSDVERAKHEVVQAALRLELDGRIRLRRPAMTLVA